jgi:hypothetical protein
VANLNPKLQSGSNRKLNLRVVKPAPALRLGGTAPADDMQPGKYLVQCEAAWIEQVGKEHRVVLQFRVTDGKHHGAGLRQWVIAANAGGVISPTGRYARYCAIALGRPVESNDPVDDPGQIFSGRFFLVSVGYRKTEQPKGGRYSDQLALVKKGDADYLRVHEILEAVDL